MDILELVRHNPGMGVQADVNGVLIIYGIWIPKEGTAPAFWLVLPAGTVFHTLHLAVAQAQCQNVREHWPDAAVRRMVAEEPPPELAGVVEAGSYHGLQEDKAIMEAK